MIDNHHTGQCILDEKSTWCHLLMIIMMMAAMSDLFTSGSTRPKRGVSFVRSLDMRHQG